MTIETFASAHTSVQSVAVSYPEVAQYDPDNWETLVEAIEGSSEFDGFKPDPMAVKNGGFHKSGRPNIVVRYARQRNAAEGLKSANIVLYGSGKLVATGCSLEELL